MLGWMYPRQNWRLSRRWFVCCIMQVCCELVLQKPALLIWRQPTGWMTSRTTHSCGEDNQVCFLYILYYFRDLQTNLCLVAHKIYGIPQTINTANYVYFLAYQELYALRESVTSTSSSSSEQLQCLYGIHTHSTLHSRFNSSHASNNIRYRTRQDSDLSVPSLSLTHLC